MTKSWGLNCAWKAQWCSVCVCVRTSDAYAGICLEEPWYSRSLRKNYGWLSAQGLFVEHTLHWQLCSPLTGSNLPSCLHTASSDHYCKRTKGHGHTSPLSIGESSSIGLTSTELGHHSSGTLFLYWVARPSNSRKKRLLCARPDTIWPWVMTSGFVSF